MTLPATKRLGVGLLFNPVLPDFIASHPEAFDYLEIIPDREWADRGVHTTPRYQPLESSFDLFRRLRASKPFVCHSIGLSIGSAGLFDTGHVEQIAHVHRDLDFAWHSDHLSFARLPGEHEMHTAISLPIPYDQEVLDLVSTRVQHIRGTVPCPFLLENNVYYVDAPDQEMTEPQFLNQLAEQSGCGILLDLHNVYVNSRNHGFTPESFLRDLDYQHVAELHIAGGDDLLGFYTDAHAGPVPEPVWGLLEDTLRAAPHVRGVTFEFHESSFPLLKNEGILAELNRMRDLWDRCH